MKKIIIANWKMQLNRVESLELAKEIKKRVKNSQAEIVVCPDFLVLADVSKILKSSPIKIGSQDCAFLDKGALTGEVSPNNLKELGVEYVLIGHSERRSQMSESGIIINKKIKAALRSDLVSVLCVGESLSEKEAGKTKKVLLSQLKEALSGVDSIKKNNLIIAYEPIWAIGTGVTINPKIANEIHGFLVDQVYKISNKKVNVIYGGSVNEMNYINFLCQDKISGLLVGGASLKADSFIKLI